MVINLLYQSARAKITQFISQVGMKVIPTHTEINPRRQPEDCELPTSAYWRVSVDRRRRQKDSETYVKRNIVNSRREKDEH